MTYFSASQCRKYKLTQTYRLSLHPWPHTLTQPSYWWGHIRPVFISSSSAKYSAIWTIPVANNPVNLRLHQSKVAISGIFGRDNHPKISWASLQNILLFVQCVFTSPKTPTRRERWAKYRELISRAWVSSFKVKSWADEDRIYNFGIISQIRNSGLFDNLELIKTGLWMKSYTCCCIVIGILGMCVMPSGALWETHSWDIWWVVSTGSSRWILGSERRVVSRCQRGTAFKQAQSLTSVSTIAQTFKKSTQGQFQYLISYPIKSHVPVM